MNLGPLMLQNNRSPVGSGLARHVTVAARGALWGHLTASFPLAQLIANPHLQSVPEHIYSSNLLGALCDKYQEFSMAV